MQLLQARFLREETDVIYLHSCYLNTKFDQFTVMCTSFLRLNVVFGRFLFISSQVKRRQKYFLPANRRIFDKLDGVMRFLFIVQVIEKVQKKAQFSCCGQRKAFHYEIVLLGIQLFFLHGGALGLSVLKCNQGSDVLGNFEVFTPWSRKLLN